MIAAKFDLQIDAGSDFAQSFTLDDPITKLPINVTGWSASAQIRKNYNDLNPLLTFVCTVGTVDGLITISLPKALTKSLPFDYPPDQCDKPIEGVWDIQVTDTTPFTQRMLKGNVKIYPQVTR